MKIQFGSDGWLGVISRDFTYDNLTLVAQALASYLENQSDGNSGVVVGYDTRFLSDLYAREIAKVLAGNGIRVLLSNKPVITPAVSYAVSHLQAQAGVMVTAGHYPYQYNGLKIKGSHGGPAMPVMLEGITEQMGQAVQMTTLDDERIIGFNPDELYFKGIAELVDLELIRRSPLKVIVDVMHGAGRGYMKYLLGSEKMHLIEVRNSLNPSFGGGSPEPIAQNLTSLVNVLLGFDADLAIAIDGDGDRIGVLDDRGQFIDAQHLFILLLKHLVENRRMGGGVAKSISTTQMVNRLAEKYHLRLHETPVGFQHICNLFLQEKILLGGEESGGFGFQGHLPERDGVLAGLLLLELLATTGASIRELLNEMEEEMGQHVYRRLDVRLPEKRLPMVSIPLKRELPTEVAGVPVVDVVRLDGVKLYLENGSWLLARPVENEPVMRFYAEGHSLEEVERILQTAPTIGLY